MLSNALLGCCLVLGTAVAAPVLDLPPTDDQVAYAPEDGDVSGITPPAFVWVPVDGASSYVVQYAQDAGFGETGTTTVGDVDMSVYIPTVTLAPGAWYWRYGVPAETGVAYSRARRFEIAPDAAPFPLPALESVMAKVPQTRPRVYFSPEDIEYFRRGAGEGHTLHQHLGQVVRDAERHLGGELYPEPPFLPEERQARTTMAVQIFRTMRPFTAGMATCALAYVYTGDPRFAEEAKRRLMHFTTWDLDGSSNVFNNTEPAMDIAQHGPRTFDWIHDTLSEEERAACIAMLTRRIADMHKLHRSRPFESRPFSSHPGRMVPFVVEGSMVLLHEVPQAREWLDYTLKLLWSVYPAWGSDDGGWHEGLSYWSSYGNRMSYLVVELDRLGIPWKNKPFVRNTGYFGLYCAYPGRQSLAFGDGQEGWVGPGHGNLLYTYASLFEDPYLRWYAEQTGGGPTGPLALHTYRPDLVAKPPADLPQARAFKSVGWVGMHSNMADPENNVMLLFKSSPYGSVSHNHASQNAFVLEAFGEPLAISSGYYQRYGSPHHAEWTWQSKAHNTLLIDGEGQVPRSAASKGFITAFENNDAFSFTTGDATAAYGGRVEKALRHVLFSRSGYILMVDEVAAEKPVTLQWLLHAKSEMALDEAQQELTISQGDVRLRVQFLDFGRRTFAQTSGFDPLPDVADSPVQFHFQASTVEPAPTHQIVTLLRPYRAGKEETLATPRLTIVPSGFTVRLADHAIHWNSRGEFPEVRVLDTSAAEEAQEVFRF